MKKVIFTTAFIMACSFPFAQGIMQVQQQLSLTGQEKAFPDQDVAEKTTVTANNGIGYAKKIKAGGDTIWYEDFGNGFPSGWTISDLSGICPWVYSHDGSWGYWNSSSATAADSAIKSTTKSNGFLICDPDSANHFTYGQPSGTTYQYLESYFTTSAINLSGYSGVILEFEQKFRKNNSIDLIVSVSNDNINWTDYTVQGDVPNNTASADPDTVRINISAVACNQPTVYIKIGWSARVYFWMIDDIKIIEAPDNDLTLQSEFYFPNYTQTPINHITNMTFSGIAANYGGNTQTNVILNTNIINDLDTVFNDYSIPISLPTCSYDSLVVNDTTFTPSFLGNYTINYMLSSDATDANPADNIITNIFTISDTIYARDNNNYTGWGVRTDISTTSQRGILYEINTIDTATSISVLLTGLTPTSGQIIVFHLYDNSLTTPVASSGFHTLTAAELGSWFTLPIPETQLLPGEYIAAFESYSDSVYVAFDPGAPPPSPQTSFFQNGGTWYYTTTYTYFIRLNTKAPPCDAVLSTSFTYSTCGVANATASVSVTGGTPNFSYSWNTTPAQTTATASNLEAGVYSVTVTDAIGCQNSAFVTVNDSGAATLTTSATQTLCNGSSDGTTTVTPTGGTQPYSYIYGHQAEVQILQ
ncbi:MAG: hypothetical protein ABII90_08545 [Bacteroidota bacterium]